MPNKLRILHKNAAKQTGVSASTTSGAFAASRMLTYDKSEAWRATGKTAALTGSSPSILYASALILPHFNGSPTATGRLRLWNDAAATSLAYDSGVNLLCPEASVEVEGWTAAQAASAYAQGGGAKGRLWFPQTAFRAWTLDLADNSNLQGYLEVASLFLGTYFEPAYDLEQGGGTVTLQDTSSQFRTAAGSLRAQSGTRHDEMTLDITMLTEADRKAVLKVLRSIGKRHPFIVSLWPDDTDDERERDHMIFGMLSDISAISLNGPDSFATELTISGI